jgi:biopolymer transport protein ExbB
MEPTQSLGIAAFLAQTDAVSRAAIVVLAAMSLASWYFIVVRAIQITTARKRAERFLAMFWAAPSLASVGEALRRDGADEAYSELTLQALNAIEHHRQHGAHRLSEAGSAGEFLTRAMRQALDAETARAEAGLTLLASVGSTAPFVGLFGTVWGVYHALVSIGMTGQGTLDKVAGPVGEALIMTALGLAVAIPAVLAYNTINRSNRVALARLDAFAHDLFAFLTTGARVDETGAGA